MDLLRAKKPSHLLQRLHYSPEWYSCGGRKNLEKGAEGEGRAVWTVRTMNCGVLQTALGTRKHAISVDSAFFF
jgi:hypothetical protein